MYAAKEATFHAVCQIPSSLIGKKNIIIIYSSIHKDSE